MNLNWDLKYNGTTIKAKTKSVRFSQSEESFCREIDVELIDTSIYSAIDWTVIPTAPTLELLIEIDSVWHSKGLFFIERPTYSVDPNERGLKGIWGRSQAAILSEPFAKTWSKSWTTKTTVFTIIDEVLSGTGVSLSRAKTNIPDFVVEPLAYSCEKAYPIDIIMELAELCGAIVLEDDAGDIYLTTINYTPNVEDALITDTDIKGYEEEIIFPEFKNRVLITSEDASDGYGIEVSAKSQCLLTGAKETKLYARVADDENVGIDNIPVEWSFRDGLVSLANPVTNTTTITITDEEVASDGFFALETTYPPMANGILSIYWKKDTAKETDYAAAGYSVDGNRITLVDELKFCDQALLVTYRCQGVATNRITSGLNYGTDLVTAEIAGAKSEIEIYVGNPCKCSGDDMGVGGDTPDECDESGFSVTVVALPVKICAAPDLINCACATGCTSQVLITAEEYTPIADGRIVTMKEITEGDPLGELEWKQAALGTVSAIEMPGTIISVEPNTVVATTCHYWSSITKLEYNHPFSGWTEVTWPITRNGKKIEWSKSFFDEEPEVGLEIRVTGNINGGAVNLFTGKTVGTATIQAQVQSLQEEPLSGEVNIEIGGESDDGSAPTGLGDGSGKSNPANPNATPCRLGDGKTVVSCVGGNVCCQKNGVTGCYSASDCYGAAGLCRTNDCQSNPTAECLGGRFPENCDCESMCQAEVGRYGTTQGYSGYRSIPTIVMEDHGLTMDDPAYWGKVEELTQAAIADCRAPCDLCLDATELVVSGSDAITKPGGYQYGVSGGVGPYTWSVGGTGATIDDTGYVTLSDEACGSIYITVTDKCGVSDNMAARVTNNGHWEAETPNQGCVGGICNHSSAKGYVIITKEDHKYSIFYKCCFPEPPYNEVCEGCPDPVGIPDYCGAIWEQSETYVCGIASNIWVC